MTSPKAIIASFLTVLVTSWSASAAGATTPMQGTQDLIAAVKAGASSSDGLVKVREYFDYEHLVREPIEPHRTKLNPEQLERYSKLFRELLEMAPLIASLGGNASLEYKIRKPVGTGDEVKVGLSAYDASTDMATDVAFQWKKSGDGWRVVDMTLDGASLIKGYQNQFGRILAKEGAEGLLKRLEQRLAETKSKSAG